MIYLLFSIGNDRYALESSQVVEVVPRVELWPLPHVPDYVPGVFRYRGRLVPVLDLCQLMLGQPCQPRLSTRILLVHYPGDGHATYILGLMVERVTDTLRPDAAHFVSTGLNTADTAYLGETAMDEHGMIHRIRVEHLLPARMRATLLAEMGSA